jgi:hypothetical protein
MNRISEKIKEYRLANLEDRTCRYCKRVFDTRKEKHAHVKEIHRPKKPVKKTVRKYSLFFRSPNHML